MARHTAMYKNREDRTSENVVRSLLQTYNGAVAVDWEAMVSEIVRDFSCQLPTATALLRQACDDGALYKLVFVEGSLHQVQRGEEVVYTFEDYPAFVDGHYYRGWLKPSDGYLPQSQRTQAIAGVAYPAVFDEWAKTHLEAVAAEKAQEKAKRAAERAQARANHPDVALLQDYGKAWRQYAYPQSMLPQVEARMFELPGGAASLTLELRGPALDAAAPKLLALLQEFFAVPDGTETPEA